MKIGIIGLPQTGKKSLFEVLTQYSPTQQDIISNKSLKSMAEIKDSRFDGLVEIYNPKKQLRARIDIELLPKIEKDVIAKGDIFKDIADLDAVCHLVRVFDDESVYHVSGTPDAKRDIDRINCELILNDLIFIEKRLQRIEGNLKKVKDQDAQKERELLLKLKQQLDKEEPLRLLELDKQQQKIIASYPFITFKKMIVVLNVSEDKLNDFSLLEELKQNYKDSNIDIMQVSAKAELEIAGLQSESERKEFLQALGIKEPAINILTRLCIKALDLVSFFTVGPDEVRQWTVTKGSTAPEAAGQIHTDLQKGFIRAEIMESEELIAAGSAEKLKQAGKFYLKGKDYIVQDGNVLCIRFNV